MKNSTTIFQLHSFEELLDVAKGASSRSLVFVVDYEARTVLAMYHGSYIYGFRSSFKDDKELNKIIAQLKQHHFTQVKPTKLDTFLEGMI